MASQVQIPFQGVILQEHSAPISCPTPNFAKGSNYYGDCNVIICPNLLESAVLGFGGTRNQRLH